MRKTLVIALLTLGAAASPAPAKEPGAAPARSTPNPLRNVYYGDLHLHTTLSFDAYVLMGTKTGPEDAYRFAKGQPVSYLGHLVRRKEPLDFLAVTDHSENMGVFNDLEDPKSELSRSDTGQRIAKEGPKAFWHVVKYMTSGTPLPGIHPAATTHSAWQREIAAANAAYEPGKFTTFIGYEWSAMPQGKNNLHRNVIFRGDKAPFPFSSIDSKRPEDLWSYLEKSRANGFEALAIPHNADASNGLMYDWVDSDGKPIDQSYAQRRAANEPLSEISQSKGQSETHPTLSPNDELASFEIFDRLLISNARSEPHGSYVREAYGRGLAIKEKTGVNPYRFGVVGGSDFHNGLTTTGEDSYNGLAGGIDPRFPADALKGPKLDLPEDEHGKADNAHLFGSGNLTGVWAEENTRQSIYDALRRKETFATSGSRLRFRFFGGWSFGKKLLDSASWVKTAYADGVPMGGDLPARPEAARAPRFALQALKDPNGANLDRVQVVKVWLKDGKHEEKIFDVAFSGHRKVDPGTGKLAAVGNTVDVPKATYKNSIGATQLAAVWEDPEFDASLPAVYYLRVLEIPTPRWSTILAAKNHQPLPRDVPATIQERGWSSPIWYTPARP